MKGSAKKCGTVGDMLVSVAAVMGTVHLVLRFVIGGFVVGTISAQLHATEVLVLHAL